MSELPDSPVVGRAYCPGCEPTADPDQEILDVRWCDTHAPPRDGADDQTLASPSYLSGSAEAGGEHNTAMCALIHRARRAA